LHLCTRYLQGGSEQRLRDIVRSVPGDHRIIIGEESNLAKARADFQGRSIEQWPGLIRQPHPIRDAGLLAKLFVHLRRERFDLMFTHQSKAGLLGRLAAALTSTPTVHSVSMASTGPGYGSFRGPAFGLAERAVARFAKGYVVVGADLLDRIVANGVPEARCVIVRSGARLPIPGTDRCERRRQINQLADISDRPWLAAVGSLEARKRSTQLPELFWAARRCSADEFDPVLLVAGGGPDHDQIESEIERLDLGAHVRLLGQIDWATELIASSDAVVLMSKAEGLPQVLVQAAAANTPFACFEVDGANELISLGARGSVLPPGDLEGLALAATEWLRSPDNSTWPLVDLSSWDVEAIAAGYSGVVLDILGPERSAP